MGGAGSGARAGTGSATVPPPKDAVGGSKASPSAWLLGLPGDPLCVMMPHFEDLKSGLLHPAGKQAFVVPGRP